MSDNFSSLSAPPVGTVLGGRYELLRFLGSGAIGAVYEASTDDGQRVALKVLHEVEQSDVGQEIQARFEREAQIASALKSDHIVPVIDFAIDDQLFIPFLVMPLLSGLDLDQLLDETGALHPAVAVRIVAQACHALEVAHAAGVVHRDIKPANLFLDHDPTGKVTARMLDFGIAKLASEEGLTQFGSIMGTPHFMSPEQFTNSKLVDARSDVWSMAAVLYHALTGAAPFEEITNLAELHLAINTREVTPIQDAAPWIEPALAQVVHGALLRAPDARCPSAAELASALEPFQMGALELADWMLEPVPFKLKSHVAERAEASSRWQPPERLSRPTEIPRTPRDPLVGVQLDSRYTCIRRLGRGRERLYEALGTNHNRYALKLLDRELAATDDAVVRRYRREAEAMKDVRSPHVIQLIEAGVDAPRQQPFLVMELLTGTDQKAAVERHGNLDPAVIARLYIQACHGLGAVHAHGLVHRNIQPSMIFLCEQPSGEVITKLLGFGLVKKLTVDREELGQVTRFGESIGSPVYASPEQAVSPSDVDWRTDLWALGACLYHALAGQPPAPIGYNPLDGLAPLRNVAPWVDPALADVVQRALTPSVNQRFQSCAELLAALEPFARSVPHVTREMIRPGPRQPLPNRAAAAPAPKPAPTPAPAAIEDEPTAASADEANGARRLERAQTNQRTLLLSLVFALVTALVGGYLAYRVLASEAEPAPAPAAPG